LDRTNEELANRKVVLSSCEMFSEKAAKRSSASPPTVNATYVHFAGTNPDRGRYRSLVSRLSVPGIRIGYAYWTTSTGITTLHIANLPSNDSLGFDETGTFEQLQDRELWLSGQRRAFASALNDDPLSETLGILVDTATSTLGEGARAAFFLTGPDGATLHHIVGMPDDYASVVDGLAVGPEP
jgi:hypothetical protein